MVFWGSSGSLQEHIKSLGKLNDQKCSKSDVTKDGRHWLETAPALNIRFC